MRWNETCTLIRKVYSQTDEGVQQPTEDRTPVFCNSRHVGAKTWSSMYEIGISVDAQVQVRSCDYSGQSHVKYRDKTYTVEVIEELGDFTVLTLRRQQSDKEDPEQDAEGSGNGD